MDTLKRIIAVSIISMLPWGISHADAQSDNTLAVAKSFLEAAGSGNGAKLTELMSDDFFGITKATNASLGLALGKAKKK